MGEVTVTLIALLYSYNITGFFPARFILCVNNIKSFDFNL